MMPEEKPFKIAIALHHGVVTCGNMGLVAQRDATIIGDTVNTVFRIESVMKQLDQKLAASQDFLSTSSQFRHRLQRSGRAPTERKIPAGAPVRNGLEQISSRICFILSLAAKAPTTPPNDAPTGQARQGPKPPHHVGFAFAQTCPFLETCRG